MVPKLAKPLMFHTACLQDDIASVPVGPGAFAAVLWSDFHIHSPFDTEVIRLPAGTPLLGRSYVDSLSEAVHQHLNGAIADSDLRLGVTLFLGHDPEEGVDGSLAAVICAEVDSWLGANTSFVLWPGVGVTTLARDDGLFAGVASSWAARDQCQPTGMH